MSNLWPDKVVSFCIFVVEELDSMGQSGLDTRITIIECVQKVQLANDFHVWKLKS